MLPRREKYPVLNHLHNVKHIVHNYHQSGITDIDLLKLARRDNRIVITKNIKHFQVNCRQHQVDVIGITEIIPPEELDKSLLAILRRWGKTKMIGRFTKIVKARRRTVR